MDIYGIKFGFSWNTLLFLVLASFCFWTGLVTKEAFYPTFGSMPSKPMPAWLRKTVCITLGVVFSFLAFLK
jgi:hypothetical protein